MTILRPLVYMLGLTLASLAVAQDPPKANLQLTMLSKVNPNGLALWDITNNALQDDGSLAPKAFTPEVWEKVAKIGAALEDAGKTLATSKGIIAAPPGAKLQDEGGAGTSK